MTTEPVIPGTSLAMRPDEFPEPEHDFPRTSDQQSIVLAGGCFWCVEAVYAQLEGVHEVTSGYAGGSAETANYEAVSTGRTDHAEAVRIAYDPERITLGLILRVFFSVAHDPTQKNRQGNDVGPQYRSAIFYADEEQREIATRYIKQLEEAGAFVRPIVTTLEPLEAFFEAESYHQGYAERNPHKPYIAFVSAPKVEKLKSYHGSLVRERVR